MKIRSAIKFHTDATFTASLSRLPADKQKLVERTVVAAQVDPANPGLRSHKISRSRDKHFRSLYVNMDLRIIVHMTSRTFRFCYTDHHDKAYSWAEKRKREVYSTTGVGK